MKKLIYLILILCLSTGNKALFSQIDKAQNNFASSSFMEHGSWYKFKISKDGVYAIDGNQLQDIGIDLSQLSPEQIHLFSYPGGMLPMENASKRPKDIVQIPIQLIQKDNQVFQAEDKIIFYADGPDQWNFESNYAGYILEKNFYSDYSHVFLCIDNIPQKIVSNINFLDKKAKTKLNQQNEFFHIYKDEYPVFPVGRRSFEKETFNENNGIRTFSFDAPNLISKTEAKISLELFGKDTESSFFSIYINDQLVKDTLFIKSISNGSSIYTRRIAYRLKYKIDQTPLNIRIEYKGSKDRIGRLGYITINGISQLKYEKPFKFSYRLSQGNGDITQFSIKDTKPQTQVWKVNDIENTHSIQGNISAGNTFSFKDEYYQENTYVAFQQEDLEKPLFDQKIENQNIHNISNIDYLIIYHPKFKTQAERLKDVHNQFGHLSIACVSTEKIYNEFSGGRTDIIGIRDCIRSIYEKENQLKYVLFFGDGSYDYKSRLDLESSFVPTYGKLNNYSPDAFVTDDFFALLSEDDGDFKSCNLVDLAIGRFPVNTEEEAKTAVDKVIAYYKSSFSSDNEWQNRLILACDNKDSFTYLKYSENLNTFLNTNTPAINIEKIYLEAFPMVLKDGTIYSPVAAQKSQDELNKGALVFCYTGHGSGTQLSSEGIFNIQTLNNLENLNRLPIFITASCEFSRFDYPSKKSAGEQVFLKPSGGAIALFTATRATFPGNNQSFVINSFYNLKDRKKGTIRIGDLYLEAKKEGDIYNMNWVLLGDPALPLAIPQHTARITSIDGEDASNLESITTTDLHSFQGQIEDGEGALISNFNGFLNYELFDQPYQIKTLENKKLKSTIEFSIQDIILQKGKVSVKDGIFEIKFKINPNCAFGKLPIKLSLIATDTIRRMSAMSNLDHLKLERKIGDTQNDGPEIELFLNNKSFKNGDLSNAKPKIYIKLSDEDGINVFGNDLGKDLKLIIDQQSEHAINLNSKYIPAINDYSKGSVELRLSETLTDGKHEINVKAFDNYGNSSEKTIRFVVKNELRLEVFEVFAFPNPSSGNVSFNFRHNQEPGKFNVRIEIFTIHGKKVHELHSEHLLKSSSFAEIRWNGTNTMGQPLPDGPYLFRLSLSDSKGNTCVRNQKLLIARP